MLPVQTICANSDMPRSNWELANKEQWRQSETRPCRKCKVIKPWAEFHKHADCLFGINSVCKQCRGPLSDSHYKTWTHEYRLLHSARSRAARKKLDFDVELADITIPSVCPMLGVPLIRKGAGRAHEHSPSIDRIDPTKGYVKGNIAVISWRANMLKNNMTVEEARLLLAYLERGK